MSRVLSDLLPHLLWALSIASQVLLILEHANPKGNLVSEAPEVIAAAPQDAPAPAPHPLTVNPVVQTVVQATQATQPPSSWAQTAAAVLAGLAQLEQPVFQISRASTRTQSEVGLGIAGLEILLSAFFPHPAA